MIYAAISNENGNSKREALFMWGITPPCRVPPASGNDRARNSEQKATKGAPLEARGDDSPRVAPGSRASANV
jgi:hypothetical protein